MLSRATLEHLLGMGPPAPPTQAHRSTDPMLVADPSVLQRHREGLPPRERPAPVLHQVEAHDMSLSPDEFVLKFMEPNRPVILKVGPCSCLQGIYRVRH
jgi:hypothetical protein